MITWKRIGAAGVELLVPGGGHLEDVPLHAGVVLLQVNPQLDVVRLGRLVNVAQVNLQTFNQIVNQSVNIWS